VATELIKVQSEVLSRVRSAVPVLPPRLAVVEICILLVLPGLLEWLWLPFPDITTFQPHPYWIAILILSLQYGTVSGLLAAAVAIIATAVIGLPEPDIGEKHFAYLIRIWTQPVMWISAALLLGHFRMRQIERRNELNRLVDELRRRGNTLATYATGLQERCNALERRLATKPDSKTGTLLDAFASASSGDEKQLHVAFRSIMDAAIPGTQAALYVIDNGHIKRIAHTSESAVTTPSPTPSEPLVAAMLNGRNLSVMSGQDDAALTGHGVFAVPISTQAASIPQGLRYFFIVEAMPPALISPATVGRLGVIAQALGASPHISDQHPVSSKTVELPPSTQSTSQGQHPPVALIPEVRSWRSARWLPSRLRPADAAVPTNVADSASPTPIKAAVTTSVASR
jgi:hypothetical protein